MKTLFILMALFYFWDCSFGCDTGFRLDWDFPGSDIKILFSPDAQHCQLLCTQEAACLFWAFIGPNCMVDNRHYNCFLKATPSGKPEQQNPKQGTTAGYSLKSCNPLPTPSLSKVYEDVNFPGADYRAFFTVDYKACQEACTDDPFCQFFSFLNEKYGNTNYRYKCYLKYSWSVPRTPSVIASADRISGFSRELQIIPSSQTECQRTLFLNTDFPGSDLEDHPAASPELCQVLCSAHPLCSYFSFVSNNSFCYLKKNLNQMVPKYVSGITSGLPSRSCPLRNVRNPFSPNHVTVYEGVDFPYSDLRSLSLDNAESCENACTSDPNCQFYTYVTSSLVCYLKRVITMPAPPKVNNLANVVSGFTLRNSFL
ncbi:coagulation factor XI-like [Gambusia affinis]|uniref:coagulation factor XI-like n=1 Tax=Gambusia affinis TaxID=33528 RepID=UPI001CDBE8B5|nr:coagulation factor XI-like [Gambusia affinis]XP_043994634.1 coagulation factor XI-like [Gambusia affinis]